MERSGCKIILTAAAVRFIITKYSAMTLWAICPRRLIFYIGKGERQMATNKYQTIRDFRVAFRQRCGNLQSSGGNIAASKKYRK